MKKLRTVLGFALMYLGAWIQGMKYVLIAALILSVIFTSCTPLGYNHSSYKRAGHGCPSQYTKESRPSYRN